MKSTTTQGPEVGQNLIKSDELGGWKGEVVKSYLA